MSFFSQTTTFNIEPIANYAGIIIYVGLAVIALWGAYCVVILWRRIRQLQFKNEADQDAFLGEIEEMIRAKKFDDLAFFCENDPRAVAQLSMLAAKNPKLSETKIRELLLERYQRDVAAELDYRNTWVQTIIKTAPMLGLFGTVVGMMGAFSKLSSSTQVSADRLASDIMFALITTAIGMAIAIPLILATAAINVWIGKLEDYVASGIARIVECFK